MRRFAFTVIVLAIFTIGFTASDDKITKEQSLDAVNSEEVVEEKESCVNLGEEKDGRLSPIEQEIADAGYKAGSLMGLMGGSIEGLSDMIKTANYMDAMSNNSGETIRKIAGDQYDTEYQAPSNTKEEDLKKIYVDNYVRGMNKAMRALQQ